jgi:hypothetical protein
MSNTIYDIDFSTAVAPKMLPPDKRYMHTVSWVNVLLSPLQYLRDIWFGSYRTGSSAPIWVNSTPYNKYDQVQYNKIVYESLIDNNSDVPTTVASWRVLQINFIGVSERVYYNGQKLTLEYAMNKWFGTTFRQPPTLSDIYIQRNSLPIGVFRVGADEDISSISYADKSSEFVINDYSFAVAFNFTIYCPVAVYNALDANATNREKIFRAFVDKYVPAGVTYNILTY